MRRFFAANIARTAVCVALAAILPALLIIAATGLQRYSVEVAAARTSGERLVRTVALRQTQLTEVAETLTQLLARLRDVRERNTGPASALFRDIVYNSPEYDNVFLLDASGRVLASALPVPGDTDFSSFMFFKRTVRRDSFSVGHVVRSPFTEDPVLIFAMPVPFEDGSGDGVVAVSMNLKSYDNALAGIVLPGDAITYFLDGSGTLASVYPKTAPGELGTLLGGELWRNVQNASEDSGLFLLEETGSPTQVAYRKLRMSGMDMPYFYILYARPETTAYAQAKSILRRDMTALALVSLLAVLAAAGIGIFALRRPWRSLLDAADQVAGGNLAARVPLAGIGGELGTLGKEFNAMAEALDKRDRELSAARDYAELSRNAKSEFLANMSHEIRTSMNAILGMAYLVLKTELNAQQKGYISKLLSAANALLRVINDILDFSKMEAGKLTMENISFSLRRIASTVRSESAARLGEKKLGFELQIAPDVPDHLVGDPLRLSQALMILVDDAINRSERGVVSLVCTLVEQDPENVTVQFAVRDAGVGLTPVQLAEMRELFDRSPEDAPSTLDKLRLRLAIGNRLFRMMDGQIEVSSVFGEGVLFTASARFGYAAGDLHEPSQVFEGQKALIVDPVELSRQDLMDILPRFGFGVECVATIEEARERLIRAEKSGSRFVVMFIDWRPSGQDIPSLVMQLKADPSLLAPPPVILTTAIGRTDLPASIEELDIDALLPKPINESLVFDTLMNILGAPGRDVTGTDASGREAGAAGSLVGMRILLAEDNSVNQQIAGELMESEGIVLTIASNGEEVVNILTESPLGAFDAVLMDLQMPKMDGFAATRTIRSKKAYAALRLPIIAMTAHSDVSEISACFDVGMNDHTGKPIIVDKLFGTLRRWLPVRAESAEVLQTAAANIKQLVSKADPESLAQLDNVLDALVPYLHEGRVAMIRTALREGESQAIEALLEDMSALAEQFLNPGGAI
ncbi:MAG: Sensor histidine kinase RcsC [Desulfovibrio sp.]